MCNIFIDTITKKTCIIKDVVNEMGITILVISFEGGATSRRKITEIKKKEDE